MNNRQTALGFLALGTVAMLAGCAATPGVQSPAADAASQMTTLAPHEVLKDDRHLMVAGVPMNFEQIQAELPETLTPAQAAQMLVKLDPGQISQNEANFSLQSYGRNFYFGRGYYNNYGFGYGLGSCLYYPYRSYYFPYYNYGGYYRRYSYANGYYPFFYGYRSSYYPYYYRGGYGGYGRGYGRRY